jgi:hypothetical protein
MVKVMAGRELAFHRARVQTPRAPQQLNKTMARQHQSALSGGRKVTPPRLALILA